MRAIARPIPDEPPVTRALGTARTLRLTGGEADGPRNRGRLRGQVLGRAARGLLAGGHTIRDAEPKYGLAVVGTVSPDGLWPKAGAQPGDALFLTKPLGTALVLGGAKRGLSDAGVAVAWMRTLNRAAAD